MILSPSFLLLLPPLHPQTASEEGLFFAALPPFPITLSSSGLGGPGPTAGHFLVENRKVFMIFKSDNEMPAFLSHGALKEGGGGSWFCF